MGGTGVIDQFLETFTRYIDSGFGLLVVEVGHGELAHLTHRLDFVEHAGLLGGYGAFLCAVTFASYVKELRGADMKWDKTEKTGKIA